MHLVRLEPHHYINIHYQQLFCLVFDQSFADSKKYSLAKSYSNVHHGAIEFFVFLLTLARIPGAYFDMNIYFGRINFRIRRSK
jgi:hypothetical protein